MMLYDFSCDVSLCSRSSQRTFQHQCSQGTDPGVSTGPAGAESCRGLVTKGLDCLGRRSWGATEGL